MEIKPQNILRTISLEEMSVLDYERVEFGLFVGTLTENIIVTFF